MRKVLPAFIVAVWAVNASAGNLPQALSDAKAQIAAKRYGEAIQILEPARSAAEAIASPEERQQALSALHFYLAAAHTGAKSVEKARMHLDSFFALNPNARGIDRSKYDPAFVALFNELSPLAKSSNTVPFSAVYPIVSLVPAKTYTPREADWTEPAALEILGSRGEKDTWRDLLRQEDRARFIDAFWKRRDPTPATAENEFLDAFLRRVSYADHAFGSPLERGALTDRGRVFVLLGEPWAIRRRPLRRFDGVFVAETRDDGFESDYRTGTVEQWFYKRDQLPMNVGKEILGFRFITHTSLGDGILQSDDDVYAKRALAVAMNPNEK